MARTHKSCSDLSASAACLSGELRAFDAGIVDRVCTFEIQVVKAPQGGGGTIGGRTCLAPLVRIEVLVSLNNTTAMRCTAQTCEGAAGECALWPRRADRGAVRVTWLPRHRETRLGTATSVPCWQARGQLESLQRPPSATEHLGMSWQGNGAMVAFVERAQG
jgi:hypothetical protein